MVLIKLLSPAHLKVKTAKMARMAKTVKMERLLPVANIMYKMVQV